MTNQKFTNVVWTFNDYYVVQTSQRQVMTYNQYVSGPFLAYEDARCFDLTDCILPTFLEHGPAVVAGISIAVDHAGPQTSPYILTYRVRSNFQMSDYFQQSDKPEEVPVVFPEKEIVKFGSPVEKISDEEKERNSQRDLHNYWNRTTEPYSRPALVFLEKKKTVPEELRDLRIPGVEWESEYREDVLHGRLFSKGDLLAYLEVIPPGLKWGTMGCWICKICLWYEPDFRTVAIRNTLAEAIEAALEGLEKDITTWTLVAKTMRGILT